MCAEKDPLTCHRTILICRHIRSEALRIAHILEDGGIEGHGEAEKRLMKTLKIPALQLFETPENLIQHAYTIQGDKIAYTPAAGVQEKAKLPA
jgi:uncharacterized protein (DUF488 family)